MVLSSLSLALQTTSLRRLSDRVWNLICGLCTNFEALTLRRSECIDTHFATGLKSNSSPPNIAGYIHSLYHGRSYSAPQPGPSHSLWQRMRLLGHCATRTGLLRSTVTRAYSNFARKRSTRVFATNSAATVTTPPTTRTPMNSKWPWYCVIAHCNS